MCVKGNMLFLNFVMLYTQLRMHVLRSKNNVGTKFVFVQHSMSQHK